MTKATSFGYLLAAACAASTLGCGGGSDTPSVPPVTPAPPTAPVLPPVTLPAPAPVSNAPYFLAAESGRFVAVIIDYAGRTSGTSSAALTLVDPANPTAPVQLEPAGTAVLLGRVTDGTPANGTLDNAYERYLVYAKAGRLWRVDLAKASTQVPVPLSSQTTAGPDGICEGSVRILQSLPGHTSVVLYRSPATAGPMGPCISGDTSTKAVRLDASPATAPTTVDGEVLTPIYSAAGAIDGWVVRKGGQLLRQSASFDAASTSVLATIDGGGWVDAFGIAGTAFPGSLFVATRRASDAPVRLQLIDLATGTTSELGELPSGWVDPIGTDSTHYYFTFHASDGSYGQIRRFGHATRQTGTELVVQEPRSGPFYIAVAGLTRDRIVYSLSDWDQHWYLKSIPKSAAGVVAGEPATSPQPTLLYPLPDNGAVPLYDWRTNETGVWQQLGSPLTTRLTSDDGTSLLASLNAQEIGQLARSSLRPGSSTIAGLLMRDRADSSFKLYSASDGALLASYGSLQGGAYYGYSAKLMRADAPALVSALYQNGSDLYFLNGLNPGLTRVTNNIASSAPPPSAATVRTDATSRVSRPERPGIVRGLWSGL